MNDNLLSVIRDEFQSMIDKSLDRAIQSQQQKNPENDHYISIKTASQLLSVSRVTVYEYIKTGRINKYKIGSTTRLLKSDVLSIVQPQ